MELDNRSKWVHIPFYSFYSFYGFAALLVMITPPTTHAEMPERTPTLVMSYDMLAGWFPARNLARNGADAAAIKQALETIIDEHAKARFDIFVQCVFARFETHRADFATAQPRSDLDKNGVTRLIDSNDDLVDIMRDRCRENGMIFLAGMRMNDRHRANPFLERMFEAHPDWRLMGNGINYQYEGARAAVLAFIDEFLDRYDVEGIEFDYLRWGHLFEPEVAEEHTSLLTEFTRRARALLDAAAAKRNRPRLILGVRVPQTLKECRSLGMDVGAWIREGMVDYVCPSDFFYTDFNTRIEDFAALTEDTACRIYPTIHPVIAQGNEATLLPESGYRAAANSFYAYGAHGISAYNYQYNWAKMYGGYKFGPKEMWPKALELMTQLRDDSTIDDGDRRYFFYPLWSGAAPTGGIKNDRIVIHRDGIQAGAMQLRIAEEPSDRSLAATLEFKVTGLVEADRITVRFNGNVIPPEDTQRTYDADGQSKDEGRQLDPFFLYRMAVPMAYFVRGDNELAVTLVQNVGDDTVDVQEVEVVFMP